MAKSPPFISAISIKMEQGGGLGLGFDEPEVSSEMKSPLVYSQISFSHNKKKKKYAGKKSLFAFSLPGGGQVVSSSSESIIVKQCSLKCSRLDMKLSRKRYAECQGSVLILSLSTHNLLRIQFVRGNKMEETDCEIIYHPSG